MATFSQNDVQRLAALARLELTEDEAATFTRQLGDVLEFVRQIQSVDTSSLDYLAEAPDDSARLREDLVLPSLDRGEVLRAAPDADAAAGLFKVPRVLNG